MQEIDELEKTGAGAIEAVPLPYRIAVAAFFKMLIKCLRALEREIHANR